jgi:hypothetical protein
MTERAASVIAFEPVLILLKAFVSTSRQQLKYSLKTDDGGILSEPYAVLSSDSGYTWFWRYAPEFGEVMVNMKTISC